MALSEMFLNELASPCDFFEYTKIFDDIKPKFEKILQDISNERNNIFNVDDVNIYLQGSYKNNVFVDENTKLEIVIELKQIKSGEFNKVTSIKNNRIIEVVQDYTLKQFKDDLYLKFLDNFPNQDIVKTNRAIQIIKNLHNILTIDVLPSFKFKKICDSTNKEIPAIIIYESITNNYVLSFPYLHNYYIEKKDKETNGNFKKVVRSFRRFSIYLVENEIIPFDSAPGYFIDCLLSNVPSKLFSGTMQEMWNKILNFLKFSNLNNFLCVHKQFDMFNNGYDGWSIVEACNFINALSYSFLNINE